MIIVQFSPNRAYKNIWKEFDKKYHESFFNENIKMMKKNLEKSKNVS